MADSIDRLTKSLRRHAFVPLVFRLSLALEQVKWDEFSEDSALAAFVLRSGYRIIKADGGITWFDTLLEAEAAGAKVVRDALGRLTAEPTLPANPDPETFAKSALIGVVIDVTRRIVQESAKHTSILGYLTGRRTLLRMLFGAADRDRIVNAVVAGRVKGKDQDAFQTAAQISVRLAKMYGEAGVGGLLITEEDEITDAACVGPFEEVVNVARYYNFPLVLLCRHPVSPELRPTICRVGANYLIAPGSEPGEVLTATPHDVFSQSDSSSTQWVRRELEKTRGHRVFMSTWEIPPNVPPEALTRMRDEIVNDAPNQGQNV
jgi:hypothetical protein